MSLLWSGLVPSVSNMGLQLKLEQQQTLAAAATNQYPLSSMAAAAAAAAAANLAHNQVRKLFYFVKLNRDTFSIKLIIVNNIEDDYFISWSCH